MRVNLSSLYAGPRGCWGPGLCDIPADIGKELIEAGVAIPVGMETRKESLEPLREAKRKPRSGARNRKAVEPKPAEDGEPSDEEDEEDSA
jgi:hypothetical protein